MAVNSFTACLLRPPRGAVVFSRDRELKRDDFYQENWTLVLWLVVFLLLGIYTDAAMAGEATLTFDRSLTCVDGSTLEGCTDWDSTTVEYGLCPLTQPNIRSQNFQSDLTELVISDIGPGIWCFQAIRVTARNGNSAPSNVAQKTISLAKLTPPVLKLLSNTKTDIVVAWTLAKTRTDGTADASWVSTRVEWGTCIDGQFGAVTASKVINAPTTSATIKALTPGTWCVRTIRVSPAPEESDPSNMVSAVLALNKPSPPSNLTAK